MWWLFSLLILALGAYFVIQAIKASNQKQQTEQERLQDDRLDDPTVASGTETEPLESSTMQTTAKPGAASASDTVSGTAAMSASAAVVEAGAQQAPSHDSNRSINTGDTLSDIREMIKILNLDEPDAGRLQIKREELAALRKGETVGIPDTNTLDDVASRLRKMLA